MAAKTGCPFKNEIGEGAAVIEAGTVAPLPRPPETGPFVGKGPKDDFLGPEATVAAGMNEGGKMPAVTDPPLPNGASTEPLGAMIPKVLMPDVVPEGKLPDCPESAAIVGAEFVGVTVPVPGCARVP